MTLTAKAITMTSATIARADIARAFEVAGLVVETRNTYPILANALLKGNGETMFVIATDLDIEVCIAVPTLVSPDFAVTLPFKMLNSAIKDAKTAESVMITPSEDGLMAAVEIGGLGMNVSALSADNFPSLKRDFTKSVKFTLPGSVFHDGLDSVKSGISKEETRYYLNGIYFHVVNDKLMMVTTDGHRMFQRTLDLPEGAKGMPGVILHTKLVNMLHRLTKGKKAPASIGVEVAERMVRLTFDNVTITSKTIDGTFPDYERVTPQNNDKKLTVDVKMAQAALSQVAAHGGKAVKLNIASDKLTLSVNNPDTGTATVSIPATFSDDDLEVGFNLAYLSDALATVGGTAVLDLADAGSPMVVTGQRDRLKVVMMPMRV